MTWAWWAWEEHDGARLIHPASANWILLRHDRRKLARLSRGVSPSEGLSRCSNQLFGPVTLGVLIFGGATGFAAYVCSYHLLSAPSPDANPALYATLAPALFTGAALIGGIIFVGVTSRHLQEDDREWLSRAAAHFLIFTVAWLLLCSVVLLAPPFIFALEGWAKSAFAAIGGLSGLTTAILGRSSRTSSQPKDKENSAAKRREWLVRVAMVTSVLVLLIGLSVASNALVVTIGKISSALSGRTATHIAQWFEHEALIKKTLLVDTLALTALLLLAGATAGRYININRFSLHGMYRNRLVRAYLGASNQDRSEISGFTGFNRTDNIAFDKLRFQKPLHVVNVALNLVSGNRLDWQQRKAESFTFSPFYSGSAHCGFRDSSEYAGGVTLGTAVTVSGAAASPNMGYHSSPLVGLIMMLMNARLGGWYGNTGDAGRRTWRHDGPQSAVSPVIREAAGLTTQDSEYVYLSDGGHFENLGLDEMVMRRCRSIVVIDSGCDADYTYEDLGNALRKVRIDLGVNIDFRTGVHRRPARTEETLCGRNHSLFGRRRGTGRHAAVHQACHNGIRVSGCVDLSFKQSDLPARIDGGSMVHGSTDRKLPHAGSADGRLHHEGLERYRSGIAFHACKVRVSGHTTEVCLGASLAVEEGYNSQPRLLSVTRDPSCRRHR